MIPTNHAFFDLRDYMQNIAQNGQETAQTAFDAFDRALGETIVQENHTERVYSALGTWGGGFFDANRVCGISSYIPREELPVTRAAWLETEWARRVYPAE